MPTIFEKIDKRLAGLEEKARVKAKKEVMKQRIMEMARGKNIWEKLELVIKIFS